MADPYTLAVNAALAYGGKVSFDGELAVPVFNTLAEMNAYAPARAGAICYNNEDGNMYKWNTTWQLMGGGAGQTYLGGTADL